MHGNDEYGIGRFEDQLVALMGDPGLAELNITRLDGRRNTEEELSTAAITLPFLTERRLVVVNHPLALANGAEGQERFLQFLEHLPESTALVLVVEDQPRRRKGSTDWEVLNGGHWLVKWLAKNGGRAALDIACRRVTKCRTDYPTSQRAGRKVTPQGPWPWRSTWITIPAWRRKRSPSCSPTSIFSAGGSGRRGTGDGGQRAVDTFAMIDAWVGRLKPHCAADALLEQQDPLSLFGMIARQFRLLLQAREVLDEGGTAPHIERELHQHPYVARKLEEQARRFTLAQLETIYHRLAQMDQALKSSQVSYEVAFDTFIAELAGA